MVTFLFLRHAATKQKRGYRAVPWPKRVHCR